MADTPPPPLHICQRDIEAYEKVLIGSKVYSEKSPKETPRWPMQIGITSSW